MPYEMPEQGARQHFTVDKLKAFMPKNTNSRAITEETVKILNDMSDGLDIGLFEEQLMSYSGLLGPGVGFKQLGQSIKYVILVNVLEMNSEKAWSIIFPEKADEMRAAGRDMSSFASQFARSKTVVEIQKKSLLSAKFSLAPEYFKSIKTLVDLRDGNAAKGAFVSSTVQLNATIALIDTLKPEEDNVLKVDLGGAAMDAQQNLAEQLAKVAEGQLEALKRGIPLADVQKLGIEVIDVEVE